MSYGLTVTAAVAESQFAGFAVSQILYTRANVPNGVPCATSTDPSEESRVTPGLADETSDNVTFATVAGIAPNLSLARTLVIAIPPVDGD